MAWQVPIWPAGAAHWCFKLQSDHLRALRHESSIGGPRSPASSDTGRTTAIGGGHVMKDVPMTRFFIDLLMFPGVSQNRGVSSTVTSRGGNNGLA